MNVRRKGERKREGEHVPHEGQLGKKEIFECLKKMLREDKEKEM